MSGNNPVTKEYFVKRLGELCLKSGLPGFPKDETDQQILLKSAVLTIGPSGTFSEKDINIKLGIWVKDISHIKNIDHVTLRRRLIDTGYLTRSKDGASYQVTQPAPHGDLFDESIDSLDIQAIITEAREEIARRKREFLERSRGK